MSSLPIIVRLSAGCKREAMENASKRLADQRETGRDKILHDVALQRTPGEAARYDLELLAWADGAFYHVWRLAEIVEDCLRPQAHACGQSKSREGGRSR